MNNSEQYNNIRKDILKAGGKISEQCLQNIYNAVSCYTEQAFPAAHTLSRLFAEGRWQSYRFVESIRFNFSFSTVLDFGCKYGHCLPFFLYLGAKKAIGAEGWDEYLKVGP